jgi:glutathione S-transferase
MELILYYAPNACSLVPYVTLTEAGAAFAVRPLSVRKSQHMMPEYLQLNPKHKVPVLVIDGMPLAENVAIQTWIARNFAAARLLPADPMLELKAISFLAWCASGIHPFLSRINSPARVCDLPGAEESVRRLAAQQLFENYKIADTCSPIANGSSIISLPSTRTSSGAFGEAPNSTSIFPNSRIVWRISSG